MATLLDRVQESTTTTGTGAYVLSGAVTGFRSFNSQASNGTIIRCVIEDGVGGYEVGDYTLGTNTLTRTTIIESSNSNNAVNWGSGTKVIYSDATVKDVLPDQTGNSGKFLITSGTDPSWSNSVSSLTLTGGTANGVLYLNGSKDATSGSALTFDGSTFKSPIIFASSTDATGSVLQIDTTSTSYGRVGGSTTMGYVAGTQSLWTISGSEQMRLTSTGLGIGTSSPGAKLDVNGASFLRGSLSVYSATGGTVDSNLLYFGSASLINAAAIYSHTDSSTAGNLILATAKSGTGTITERMRLDSSGNVGIGVTPSAWWAGGKALQIGSYVALSGYPNEMDLSCNSYFNGTNYIYLNSSQRASYYAQTSGQHQWFTAPSGTAGDAISFTQAMTLDASGNLLVGTTVLASSNTNSIMLQQAAGGGYWQHASGTGAGATYHQFNYNASAIGSITQNGTTGVLYNITSDYRLKDVLGIVTGHGERIDALEPVEYDWKSDGSRARGFIAHKFQEVYPSSVTGEKDAVDEDGKPVYQTMQASTSEVIADLVAEIQSLRKRIATLEGK